MVEPTAEVEVTPASVEAFNNKSTSIASQVVAPEVTERSPSPVKTTKKAIKKPEVHPTRSSGRTRSITTRFDPSVSNSKSNEEDQISESEALKHGNGKGTALGEIPRVIKAINKIAAGDNFLIALHRILFISQGSNNTRKKHIKSFSGFVWGEKFTQEMARNRLNDKKWTVKMLKDLCTFLDIPSTDAKTQVINNILEFLEAPKEQEDHVDSEEGNSETKKNDTKRRKKGEEEKDAKKSVKKKKTANTKKGNNSSKMKQMEEEEDEEEEEHEDSEVDDGSSN